MTLKRVALVVTFLLLAASAGVRAQIPQEFKNLQVLPKDISRAELVATMRRIAGDLGVRCTYCHVGPDNLQGMNFATDEKRAKQVARTMLTMVRAINAEYVSTVPAGSEPRQTVACVTCHRRSAMPPRPLPALLYETLITGGTQAAIDQHRKLREEFLDAGLYDFRESTLNILATRLRDESKFAEALEILKRNIELFPKSANALSNAGDTALQMQNMALAEDYYKKALAIDPAHAGATAGMSRIKR